MKSVAIIIVNYNGTSDTIDCVNSIFESDCENYKIYIADNGSDGEQISRLSAFCEKYRTKIKLLLLNKNSGFAGGNNAAIEEAQRDGGFDFYLLLNNDTVVEKDFLPKILTAAQSDERTGITTCKINYESDRQKIWYGGGKIVKCLGKAVHFNYGKRDKCGDKSRFVTFASGCVQLISARCIAQTGALDEDYFLYSEDADYCCKALRAGFKIFYEPKSKVYHKVSASAKINSQLQQYYLVRAYLMFIKSNVPALFKPLAYLRYYCLCKYKISKKIFSPRAVAFAYEDFKRGVVGKSERF